MRSAVAFALLAAIAGAYKNTVMPNGECNITTPSNSNLTVPDPIQENAHIIATFWSPHYGAHVLVRGRDTKIYHKHQIAPDEDANWTAWKCLTPDLAKIPCSTAPACGGYDNAPAVAWQPGVNGTAMVFMRQIGDLDLHETHLTDPTDPDSWSDIRAPACICNYPPCKNQTRCGVAQCDAKGVDCSKEPTSSRRYWSYGTFFPTSEVNLLVEDQKLAMYYRGFDGGYYKAVQEVAGDAGGKFLYPPKRLGGFRDDINAVIE